MNALLIAASCSPSSATSPPIAILTSSILTSSILTSSILSIAGVVLALLIIRTDFNVASFMGLIMVIGIVAKNGILLLDADEKFRAEAESTPHHDGRDLREAH